MSYDPPSPQPGANMPPEGGGHEEPAMPASGDYTQPTDSGGYTQPTGGPGGYMPPPPPQGGYTQPIGGSQPGGYAPPPGGGYTPPQGGGYTPPPGGGYNVPPPPPPGGGMGGMNIPSMGGVNQASLQNLLQKYITVVTKPSAANYEAEIPQANWTNTLIGVAAVAIVSFIISLLFAGASAAMLAPLRSQLSSNGSTFDPTIFAGGVGAGGAVLGLFFTFVFFFLGALVLYISAKIFGGQGTNFMTHAYLLSLSYTPLRIVSTIVSIIPIIGSLVSIVLFLYQIYQAGLSMQASQRMAPGKAQLAAFVPLLIGIVLGCLVLVLCVGLFAAALNGSSR